VTAREAVIDASIFGALVTNPGLTPEGLRFTFRAFATAEIVEALVRLGAAELVRSQVMTPPGIVCWFPAEVAP
jgi:hypothetical protein